MIYSKIIFIILWGNLKYEVNYLLTYIITFFLKFHLYLYLKLNGKKLLEFIFYYLL